MPGGLKVDVCSPKERVRHILFAPEPARIKHVLETETEPPVSLKVCAETGELAPHLPTRWACHEQRYLMMAKLSAAQSRKRRDRPTGYAISVRRTQAIVTAEVRDGSGAMTARGRIALTGPYVIVDDIVTEPTHRWRGLGRMIMTALNQAALEAGAATGLLVATPDGLALYRSVGWLVHTPYASAYLA